MLSNKGFGLMEVVLGSAIVLTIGLGALRITEVVVGNSLLQNTYIEEQDLKSAIRRALNEECLSVLDPQAVDPSTGNILSLNLLKETVYNLPEDFKPSGLIHIVKAELKPGAGYRRFKLYYKKSRLGVHSTQQDPSDSDIEVCSTTDQEGCYVTTCDVNYKPTATPKVCYATNCESANHLASEICPTGQYLKGFTANGGTDCQPLPACDDGFVFQGFESDGVTKKCAKACDPGLVLSRVAGKNVCVALLQPRQAEAGNERAGRFVCPAGQVLQGISETREPICTSLCTGGAVWNEDKKPNPGCDCDSPKIWNGSTCTCPSGTINGENCTCSGGRVLQGSSCVCPAGKPFLVNNTCKAQRPTIRRQTSQQTSCSGGRIRVGNVCACPAGKKWNGSRCNVIQCPYYQRVSDKQCVRRCPGRSFYWKDGPGNPRCMPCTNGKTSTNGATCNSCISGYTWVSSNQSCSRSTGCTGGRIRSGSSCVCPAGKAWYSSRNECRTDCTATQRSYGMIFERGSCRCPYNHDLSPVRYDERQDPIPPRCEERENQRF